MHTKCLFHARPYSKDFMYMDSSHSQNNPERYVCFGFVLANEDTEVQSY
jgi:hypothetical protein